MYDACVIGDSLPAFAAALELAEVGLKVRLVLPDGGDWPTTGERDPEGAIAALLDRVASPIASDGPGEPSARPVREAPHRVLLQNARGGWSPVPHPAVFGIPAVPASSETLAFLRGGAAVRAYLDRVKPLLTIGKTHELGRLVHLRMGDAVRERLVDPLVRERFGAADVEVAAAAPGLNEALTLAGALSSAVLAYSDRHVARETGVVPRGGWPALRRALIERLALYGVDLSGPGLAEEPGGGGAASASTTAVEVQELQGSWRVRDASGEVEAQALVADADVALPAALAEALAAQRSPRARFSLTVPVAPDGDLAEAVVAARSAAVARPEAAAPSEPGAPAPSFDAVRTVVLPSGEQWSVRVGHGADGVLAARAVGPAVGRADLAVDRAAADAREALALAGASMAGPERFEVRAAPYGAIAERDADRARVSSEREAEPNLLLVGRALHGDDLGAAVADSALSTVALRRRLTGIAD